MRSFLHVPISISSKIILKIVLYCSISRFVLHFNLRFYSLFFKGALNLRFQSNFFQNSLEFPSSQTLTSYPKTSFQTHSIFILLRNFLPTSQIEKLSHHFQHDSLYESPNEKKFNRSKAFSPFLARWWWKIDCFPFEYFALFFLLISEILYMLVV